MRVFSSLLDLTHAVGKAQQQDSKTSGSEDRDGADGAVGSVDLGDEDRERRRKTYNDLAILLIHGSMIV